MAAVTLVGPPEIYSLKSNPSPTTATETTVTTATKKRTKIARFIAAKAMAVSTGAPRRPAKVMTVSTPGTYERAKATGVSKNRTAWPMGPGRASRRRAEPHVSSTPGTTGVEGAGGTGGPGRGAGGRRGQGTHMPARLETTAGPAGQ